MFPGTCCPKKAWWDSRSHASLRFCSVPEVAGQNRCVVYTQKQKLTILRLSQELAGGDFCHIPLVKASHMSKADSRGEEYMSVNREVYLFGNFSITDFHNPLNGCLLAIHKGQAESRCNGRPHRHRLLKCSECRGPSHCWALRQVPLPV